MQHPGVEVVAVNDPFIDAGARGRSVRRAGVALVARVPNTHASAPSQHLMLSLCHSHHPLNGAVEYMAYMLKYDSVHGRFPHDLRGDSTGLYIDGKKVEVHAKL